MIKDLTIEKSISIDAKDSEIWDTLTNPEKVKEYLFGTNLITDWNVGSTIFFEGEYDGHKYKDGGKILAIEQGKLLQYTYWSGFSGMEDKEENYSIVTYKIDTTPLQTLVTVNQQGFASKQASEHSASNWELVLVQIKEISERG